MAQGKGPAGITRTHPGHVSGAKEGGGHRSHGKGPHKAAKMPERTSLGHIGTHSPHSSGPKGGYPMGAASGSMKLAKGHTGKIRGG
jgi:hypothetical protein